MGNIRTALAGQNDRLGYSCTSIPLMFGRTLDYNVAGNPRPSIQTTWELTMRSMVTVDLITRKLLFPIIENRMETITAETKYQQEVVTLPKNSTLTEAKVFEYHDLFQIFEIESDGKISTADLIIELENFEDETPLKTFVEIIARFDDGNNHMSFQQFIELMQFLDKPENAKHSLRITFNKILAINRCIRQMSVTQQVLCGLL
ncbi:unnamed protein product [Allacma fusca]|uniref:EF-hand domain-containing protein n=1 Tax=Allacma fusca TaxID=39272 RepID=A0A8J2P9F0_9HEXA|nr:unnamed protein product [Allacma fusca]